MKIQSIKPQLTPLSTFWSEDAHTLRIPTIQRQFVWDSEDVRDLIDSIVNGYPVGAIIIWEPTSEFPSAPLVRVSQISGSIVEESSRRKRVGFPARIG